MHDHVHILLKKHPTNLHMLMKKKYQFGMHHNYLSTYFFINIYIYR